MDHDASNRNLYHTIHVYFICNINRAYRPLCEHMRAFAYDASACNASICECTHSHRIACERISHASCEHSHTLFGRLPCPLCAHSHAMRVHSHRMRPHSHRMRLHRMRMRAFKGNWCVSGTVSVWLRIIHCCYKDPMEVIMLFATCQHTPDDVIMWKHFPRYWPFVRGIHRSLVKSPYKDQWRGALIFSLICTWTYGWVNNRDAGDLRRHRAYNNDIVMVKDILKRTQPPDMVTDVWCT